MSLPNNYLEKWLNLTLWKAVLGVFLIFILCSVLVEEVLVHTVFVFFDRLLIAMEIQSKEDIADRNKDEKNFQLSDEKKQADWSKLTAHEIKVDRELMQNRYCLEYRALIKDKKSLNDAIKMPQGSISLDEKWNQWKQASIARHSQEIKIAIKENQFNPAICKMDNQS